VTLVSPDGRSLLAIVGDGKGLIFPIEGGEPRTIAGLQSGDVPLGWSGDGRSLYVVRHRGIAAQIHRLDPRTGRSELLHELAPVDAAGASRVGWLAISADGKSYAYSFIRNLSELYLVEGLK
jgi:hypothetical protein